MLKQSLLFILILFSFPVYSQNSIPDQTINFNEDWLVTSGNFDQWYTASVPGSIHTDLYQNKLIPNPFFGSNENKLQWIDTVEWIYQKEFAKPKNLKKEDQLELVFKGLDTYAEVFLNDSVLIETNNMFLPWKAKIDQKALRDQNILTVKFKPTLKEEQKRYKELGYDLPGGSRVFTRKAAYQYGWDWAPKYVGCSIWQDIELHIWNGARIQELSYSIEKMDSSIAMVNIQATIEATEDFSGNIRMYSKTESLEYQFKDIQIQKGTHNYDFKISIQNPKLWWTWNLGDPFLYHFNISLHGANKIYDSEKLNIGIRPIELTKKPDELGESFYFKLNGIPVFMKGANYVPQSSFPGGVSDQSYHNIIEDVKEAHMNMLRVWGGGIYEKDIFYDFCDQEGILIWQDFMFANAMYPKDSGLIENIKREANYQVKRLSKHPSIALWCGNNEIDEAWHNWGWSRNYSKSDSTEIWENYLNIFRDILPKTVDSLNPNISYTSTSPLFGRGNLRSSYEGDNHYWYVWHDAYDFDWYNKVTGRFMSEFGFQSFPGMETIEYFDTSDIKHKDSDVMLAHQKHHKGNYLINHYMKGYYPVPDKFDDYLYVSQLLQAEGIRTGILAQRRAKPFCMGSLYWQLNDCWPAISWSSIDYLGNWKALHYFAKQDFKNIIVDPYLNKDSLEIYVFSDSLVALDLSLKFSLMDFEGTIKLSEIKKVTIRKNTSEKVYHKRVSNILDQNKLQNHLLYLELTEGEKLLDSRTFYFTEPKNLELPEFEIQTISNPDKAGYEIILKSKKLVKNLYIHLPNKGQFSDNYFDLLPNIEKKITFKTDEKIDNISNSIEFKSLNHIQP